MVTVYVWMPKLNDEGSKWTFGFGLNVGHAAMLVETDGGRRYYISWWPDEARLGNVSPIRNRRQIRDEESEGAGADHTIEIGGMDENAIADWWEGYGLGGGNRHSNEVRQGPLPAYNLIVQNCSTIVGMGLNIGMDNALYNPGIWTPIHVLEYARRLSATVRERRR